MGYVPITVPSVWTLNTFTDKLGKEKESQMWEFQDKGGRNLCLIPEVTAVIQELWNCGKLGDSSIRLFYVSRCYRYERPQLGRYREFTQFGVEAIGYSDAKGAEEACILDLVDFIGMFDIPTELVVRNRGIDYYEDKGFEVECPLLGAQKQIAGGGRYKEGVGWAIGVDRLLLAIERATPGSYEGVDNEAF